MEESICRLAPGLFKGESSQAGAQSSWAWMVKETGVMGAEPGVR